MKKLIGCCFIILSMFSLFGCGKEELQRVESEKWVFSVRVVEDATKDLNVIQWCDETITSSTGKFCVYSLNDFPVEIHFLAKNEDEKILELSENGVGVQYQISKNKEYTVGVSAQKDAGTQIGFVVYTDENNEIPEEVLNKRNQNDVSEETPSTVQEPEELESEDGLPAFSFDEEETTKNAILQYFEELDRYYQPEGSVYIPAYCIFKEEVDEDNEELVKVYGNFWSFTYSLQDDILFCESGGEDPGVIYLRKEQDGTYVVDHMDAVGDGSQYTEDIERICAGNEALKKQYFSSGDASIDPLRAVRLYNVARYVEKNHLQVWAYQDYGWDPVPLAEVDSWNSVKENE